MYSPPILHPLPSMVCRGTEALPFGQVLCMCHSASRESHLLVDWAATTCKDQPRGKPYMDFCSGPAVQSQLHNCQNQPHGPTRLLTTKQSQIIGSSKGLWLMQPQLPPFCFISQSAWFMHQLLGGWRLFPKTASLSWKCRIECVLPKGKLVSKWMEEEGSGIHVSFLYQIHHCWFR